MRGYFSIVSSAPLAPTSAGFLPSGMFSGFGSYRAELYQTRARAGLGFTYKTGRGLGALFLS